MVHRQSTLHIGNPRITCKQCGMTYYKHIPSDKQSHLQYHATFCSGVVWPFSNTPIEEYRVNHRGRVNVELTIGNKNQESQMRRVAQAVAMVNQELNSCGDSGQWRQKQWNGDIEPKAFMAIIHHRVVGVCTTDSVTVGTEQCRWMVGDSQEIVPRQINSAIKIGISRIWVAPKWRRKGIGMKLLEMVMKYSVYGVKLEAKNLGFSQPSAAGRGLAEKVCGVKHKTGRVLIPVYIEQ